MALAHTKTELRGFSKESLITALIELEAKRATVEAALAAAHAENERLRADLVEQDRMMRIIEKNNGRIFAECQRLRAALAPRQADTAGTEEESE